METLKNCPFCNAQPEDVGDYYIVPHDYRCIFTHGHMLLPSEVKAWNTRAKETTNGN